LSFLDFAVTYFTSQPIVLTLAILYSSLAFLFVLFKLEKYRPHLRLQILFASFAVVIMSWVFVASSLLLCGAFIGLYQAGQDLKAVRTVFGAAVLASLVFAVPLSSFVSFRVPGEIARRLVAELAEPDAAVVRSAGKIAEALRVSALTILQSPSKVPFAYSVGGAESVVVVSKGLTTQLDEDELETVLAHELAHVKNHDTGLITVVAVFRRVLFFDPFIRLVERAIFGEKEFSADEVSARETKKPLSLASALLKISSAQSSGGGSGAKIAGLSILGSGKMLRPPGVKERVERLMRLTTEMEREEILRTSSPQSG